MNYPEITNWLAEDILSSTENPEDIEANVDRYMEDLTKSVFAKAEELSNSQKPTADVTLAERGWVFAEPDTEKVIRLINAANFETAAEAKKAFQQLYGGDFDMYFQDQTGHWSRCTGDSKPEDFA